MVSVVRCCSLGWCGAKCSASFSSGRVAWTALWREGELAFGVCCPSVNVRQAPISGRFSLAVHVLADGRMELLFGAQPSKFMGPPVEPGETITIAVDADDGVVFVAAGRRLLALEPHAPLRQRRVVRRRPSGEYATASFVDDDGQQHQADEGDEGEEWRTGRARRRRRQEEQRQQQQQWQQQQRRQQQQEEESVHEQVMLEAEQPDAREMAVARRGERGAAEEEGAEEAEEAEEETMEEEDDEEEDEARGGGGAHPDRAAIVLPDELASADLLPFISLRSASAADVSPASRKAPPSIADDFLDDADGFGGSSSAHSAAEAVVQFGPTLDVPYLPRGFRPLSIALAAQRSGGRDVALTAAPPSFLPNVPPGGEDLGWESFLSLLGARGHLEMGGCPSSQWWTMVQETDSEQLSVGAYECAVCCDALVPPAVGTAITASAAGAAVTSGGNELIVGTSTTTLEPSVTRVMPGNEPVGTICGHRYHHRCILRWLVSSQTCPVCRSALDPECNVRLLGSDPARHALAASARALLGQLAATPDPAPSPSVTAFPRLGHATADAAREPQSGADEAATSPGAAAVAAARALGSVEATAASLLGRYASEARASSAIGCAAVETACGLTPLREALCDGVFPQLRCCASLPLPLLSQPPPSVTSPPRSPRLRGRALTHRRPEGAACRRRALAAPGAVPQAGGSSVCRELLLRSYAAVEASMAGLSSAKQEVRAAFSSFRLLWGGPTVGFGRLDEVLAGAPHTAAALRRPDPLSVFPELAHLLEGVLSLPQLTPRPVLSGASSAVRRWKGRWRGR